MKKQIKLICFTFLLLLLINIKVLANEDTTIIDVSNMSIGENVIHNHIYKSQYDDTHHWTECLICHDKQNVAEHTLDITWKLGYESCQSANYAIKTCECGYNVTYNKPCVWKGTYTCQRNQYYHVKMCSVCKEGIVHNYYINTYGTGQYVSTEQAHYEWNNSSCLNSNGEIISCLTGGTCAYGKVTHSKNYHRLVAKENVIKCILCDTIFADVTYDVKYDNSTPTNCEITININTKNGATFNTLSKLVDTNNALSSQSNSYTTNSSKTTTTITYKANFNSLCKTTYCVYPNFSLKISGNSNSMLMAIDLKTDIIKPIIDDMETNNISITNDDWISSKKIIINGTENYSNIVSIEVIDENGNIVYNGTTTVNNQNYKFEFIPAIEANDTEKIYTISVTDANENTTTTELVVSKIDSKEPTFVITDSENMTQENNNMVIEKGGWSKFKTYDLYFKDEGIGQVSIGINNYDDITSTTYDENIGAYKRNYTFIGDAYKPVNCVIYAKDALGNLSTITLVLDKIDNTSPTIEKIDKEINVVEVLSVSSEEEIPNNQTSQTTYASVTITANDINEKLGLEGSGVVSYGVQSFNNNENNEIVWYDTNEIEITQNGTYYIYVMDYVGNISQPMLLVVDELTSEEDNNSNKVNVYVTQASTFSVVIPKTIILSGETKNATYQILVKGDIGGLDTISVTPDNLLALQQYGKDNVLANVTQEKTTFNLKDGMTNDTPAIANGSIIAPNMSAGSWSGSFNFNIKFNVISVNNSIGSIKEDATSDTIVGHDQVQDKYTSYTYGVENNLTNENELTK